MRALCAREMNSVISKELEVLWADFNESDLDEKLAAFERLNTAATTDDLPQLIDALKSDRNDFWVRELLSEPISELGGSKYLSELFDALQINYAEGHDNDGFNHFLTEIAWAEPQACKAKLLELLSDESFAHKKAARWLIEFCE